MRKIGFVILILALVFAVGCGGSSSSTPTTPTTPTTTTVTSTPGSGQTIAAQGAANVALLSVNAGPLPGTSPQANVAYTTVTVCAPGTSTCVTIPNIVVDTGSSGLRVLSSFVSTLNLLNVNPSHPVAECIQFLDNSFFFGSVRVADVRMGGPNGDGTGTSNFELASSVPIHVMGDTSVPTGTSIPTSCSTVTTLGGSKITGTDEDTAQLLGANGLLGVGNFQYDCDNLGGGNACTSTSTLPTGLYYYTCTGATQTSCGSGTAGAPIAVQTPQQVRNPVSMFTTDNNGVILELPTVTAGVGGTNVPGSLVFGIGTRANNGLSSSAVILTIDTNESHADWAGFTTTFNNVLYPNSAENNILLANNSYTVGSFLDSGSNGIFFLDQATSGIMDCSPGSVSPDFYCPTSTQSLTAFNQATGSSISSQVPFNVSNANTLFSGNNTAFSDLAGPNTTGTGLNSQTTAADGFFDWGLSFFYGRNVYTAIQGVSPPSTPASGVAVPAGPFWAY